MGSVGEGKVNKELLTLSALERVVSGVLEAARWKKAFMPATPLCEDNRN